MIEYAIYRGDTFLFIGTLKECAKRLDIQEASINFWTTPSGKKKFEATRNQEAMTAVKLKGGEEE